MTTVSLMTGLRKYFLMGTELANQRDLAQKVTKKFPEVSQRSLALHIVRPRPDVREHILDWLRLFAEDRLRPGAVSEETFAMVSEEGILRVTDLELVPKPTVTFYVEVDTCWKLAARRETVYTAYIKGLPLRVKGHFIIRDMELIDEILNTFYELMREEGKDLAKLFAGAF